MVGIRNERSGDRLTGPKVELKPAGEGVRVYHAAEEVLLRMINEPLPARWVLSSCERHLSGMDQWQR